MTGFDYDTITKYLIAVRCEGPLHVGSAVGDRTEVLVHPVSGKPFVQASSIAGVFRSCYSKKNSNVCDELFGASRMKENLNSNESQSRIRFEDGAFTEAVSMELRPHIRIDAASGTVGTASGSGQKFDMEYIGAGSSFEFSAYLYEDSKGTVSLAEEFESILSVLKSGGLQFGAKKSNGSGKTSLIHARKRVFDLRNSEDRKAWVKEEQMDEADYSDITSSIASDQTGQNAYRVTVTARTIGVIQVRGIAVSEFGKGAPDSMNLRNALNEFIVPGSSLKGAFRGRMEKIAKYLNREALVREAFGYANDSKNEGKAGQLFFGDAVIGDKEANEQVINRSRIHIDKFTGGVFHQGLFSEKNAFGDISFAIDISDNPHADAMLGLLVYALRDLAAGMFNIGNGYSVGKGFLEIEQIAVVSSDGKTAMINPVKNRIEDNEKLINKALQSLQSEEGQK